MRPARNASVPGLPPGARTRIPGTGRRTTRRARLLILALLPLALVGSACTAGPSERPAVAYRDARPEQPPAPKPPGPAAAPPLAEPRMSLLDWQDCTAPTNQRLSEAGTSSNLTFRCSDTISTLDPPDAPGFGQTHLSLLAVGRGKVPLVVVNDIAGEPGTSYAARLATRLPSRMLDTFQIIGMDRRGSGQSDPTDCIPAPQRTTIAGFDPRANGRQALDGLLDSVRSASQECLLNLDERLPAYDTWRTAGDLNELRVALGVPRLHAIGSGEGSRVLSTYAQRYPQSVGRMVFDGAPDPRGDALARGEAQARAAERAFDAFAARCQARGCPLGPDPRRTVSDLVERTRAQALPGGTTAGEIVEVMLATLGEPRRWPELVDALDRADRGDDTTLARMAAPLVTSRPAEPARLDAELVTSCNDSTMRVPPEQLARINQDWLAKNSLFGGVFAQRVLWCSQWPVPQRAIPAPNAPGLPPIPVISTATDPRNPADGSRSMAEELASGIAVRWAGAGDDALGRSACATEAATRYLLEGRPPQDTMICPP